MQCAIPAFPAVWPALVRSSVQSATSPATGPPMGLSVCVLLRTTKLFREALRLAALVRLRSLAAQLV